MNEQLVTKALPGKDGVPHEHLIELVSNLREKEALGKIDEMLSAGFKPSEIMESCIEAMHEVGRRFEEGRYFMTALIMAGEIMRRATKLLESHFPRHTPKEAVGVILLGTVLGDIHDLGKNLFALLARCEGFHVVDLGVDVAPERFLSEAQHVNPDLIGISCVVTSTMSDLKKAVELLHKELPQGRAEVMIGGNCIDEHIFKYVQADHWAVNAVQGAKDCLRIIAEKNRRLPTTGDNQKNPST